MNKIYYEQVVLLLKILPLINEVRDFSLKGGTAINLFYRAMPRLSVDIDLTYTPISSREEALNGITEGLDVIKEKIKRHFPKARVHKRYLGDTQYVSGLNVQLNGARVKIEVNTVIRGSVFSPQIVSLSPIVSEEFGVEFSVLCLSFEDLFAGKICAALDRQHPRDFFDLKILLENEGISDNLRKTFIIYLLSNNRPIVELLNPNKLDIKSVFENEFRGMTRRDVLLDELIYIREKLINDLQRSMTMNEKKFLLSFKSGKPNWDLLGLDNEVLPKLPAIKWKLHNIQKMPNNKHFNAYNKLKKLLFP